MNVLEVKAVTKRFGDVTAVDDISFEVQSGQIVALLGPSGCGKTTTLRLIAGFEMPDAGRVLISGQDMRGRRPYERNVGLLFQDYALFPHMTVAQNVAYGMRHRGFDRREIPDRTARKLDLVKLRGLEDRRPAQLSGGQQQRVALARALATEPEVMLLDEPLSALDAKLREELRVELKEILNTVGSTTIVVTHDQEEAMSLAEHVIVMNSGKIVQQDAPTTIYARPNNKFVAEFIGRSNWFTGRIGPKAANGMCRFEIAEGPILFVPVPDDLSAEQYEICVRPERINVGRGESGSEAVQPDLNVLFGTVEDAAYLGADVHLFVRLDSGQRIAVTEKNVGQPPENRGDVVALRFRAGDCIVVPVSGST